MLQLYAWSPALDLPSIDPQCLAIQCYLCILDVEFSVIECNDPNVSPTGKKALSPSRRRSALRVFPSPRVFL